MRPARVECGLCEQTFASRTRLSEHMLKHKETTIKWECERCHWVFSDQLSLEQHAIQTGHNIAQDVECSTCGKHFTALAELDKHRRFPAPCSDAFLPTAKRFLSAVSANTAAKSPADGRYSIEQLKNLRNSSSAEPAMTVTARPDDDHTSPAFEGHREKTDPEKSLLKICRKPKPRNNEAGDYRSTATVVECSPVALSTVFPMPKAPSTSGTDDGIRCETCMKLFASVAAYNRHFLFCTAVAEAPPRSSVGPIPELETYRKNERPVTKNNTVPQDGTGSPCQVRQDQGQLYTQSQLARDDAAPRLASDAPKPPFTEGSFGAAAGNHLASLPLTHQRQTLNSASRQPLEKSELQTRVAAIQKSPSAARRSDMVAVSTASTGTGWRSETAAVDRFACSAPRCKKVFKTEPALKTHLADVHGIGGSQLDIGGKDSWMLSQRTRELMKQSLLAPTVPARGSTSTGGNDNSKLANGGKGSWKSDQDSHKVSKQGDLTPVPSLARSSSRNAQPVRSPPSRFTQPGMPPGPTRSRSAVPSVLAGRVALVPQPIPSFNFQLPAIPAPAAAVQPFPIAQVVPKEDEMDQAHKIAHLILRLKLQDDIELHDDGKITCTGSIWKRMTIASQAQLTSTLEPLCHLPRKLQTDFHVPPPIAFQQEHARRIYVEGNFLHSPAPRSPRAAPSVLALSCIKIVLADGLHEVVKVAAIDVATCRILMNNLVCADSKVRVHDWQTKVTGLAGFDEIEEARKAGYKVFRGWKAVRSALFKFVDSDTIIVGHDLRANLDALRITHGRAVDVAKVVEKAADGPLSMMQLALDTLCREFPKIQLPTHRQFGRDALQNAFAVRELALWCTKNKEDLGRRAKRMSLDYQRLVPAK